MAGLSGKELIHWIESQVENGTLSDQLIDFLKLGPYSAKEDVIQDKQLFGSEIKNLLIAVGGPKQSLLSTWLNRLPLIKLRKAI